MVEGREMTATAGPARRRDGGWRRRVTLLVTMLLVALSAVALDHEEVGAQTVGEGSWALTGSLTVPRWDHTTTLLANGRVLAAGGRLMAPSNPLVALRSAEVYDPRSGVWTPTGSMNDARWRHTATLLPDGRVLVAGGFGDPYTPGANAQPVLDTAEIYNPATGTWTRTGNMVTRRALHVAQLLPDGRVLVAGGRTCDQPPPTACNFTFRSPLAEVYDPATGTWTPTAPLSHNRHTTAAALLQNGQVLIPAGFTEEGNSQTADLYNPATGTMRPTAGNLNIGRARQGAMLLPDGRVLVASGFGGANTAELYNPATETWSLTGNLSANRFNFSYAVLPNGKALVAGGISSGVALRSAELYDPATGQWTRAADMNDSHGSSSSLANSDLAVVLSSNPTTLEYAPDVCGDNCGKVLVAGNNATGSAELYTPACGAGLPLTACPPHCTVTGVGNIAGTPGDDVICGSSGPDNIAAGDGNDVVFGFGGDDRLSGGPGNDTMFGQSGDDRLAGGPGNDNLSGGLGRDLVVGDTGTDVCEGEQVASCP